MYLQDLFISEVEEQPAPRWVTDKPQECTAVAKACKTDEHIAFLQTSVVLVSFLHKV